MRILILSFYYYPDLCAGSFRCTALVEQLKQLVDSDCDIEVITTMPNRYTSFNVEATQLEQWQNLTIKRIALPAHNSSMIHQVKGYLRFAKKVCRLTKHTDYDLVFATSGRLMTAVLAAWIARQKKAKLYLDIRDIFVDTISDVFANKIARVIKPLFSILERWSFMRADRINIVSKGFLPYFKNRYATKNLSFFTNGIDTEFTQLDHENRCPPTESFQPLTVVYAGNIGEGQGLHRIIPDLAKHFEKSMHFKIIGDGGKKTTLEDNLKAYGCNNVELLPPMRRAELVKTYLSADVLFLHLNDYEAFRKVLPSKLFEYASTGKPIWAGVSGYAAEFVNTEIENAVVFNPCDPAQATAVLSMLELGYIDRAKFNEKFDRQTIMREMAADMLNVARGY